MVMSSLDTPVVRVHARPIRIEDAHHFRFEAVLAVIIEKQRLGAAFAFVIAGAIADRIDAAPISFLLRMNLGIAVNLRRRSLQDARFHALGEAEHIDRAVHAGLCRLHRIELIMNRRSWTGEIVDLVDFDIERVSYVMSQKLEVLVINEVGDISTSPGEKVVET